MALNVVIMAAGKGTRMKSATPKVLHRLAGRSLLQHVLDAAARMGANRTVVITGHGADEVEAACAGSGAVFARQMPQLGTGHAIQQAVPWLDDEHGITLILNGDVPLIRAETAAALVQACGGAKLALLTIELADATGYGRSDCPNTEHSVENWADEGALLLDALGLDRVFVHGTSMGGMVTIAFVGKYPERTIAACADCGMARCDLYRKVYFGTWRKMAEAMPLDDFCDLVTIQAVGDQFLADNPGTFDLVRHVIRLNPPYTVRWACLAMENMDNEHLARQIQRPILFTNG